MKDKNIPISEHVIAIHSDVREIKTIQGYQQAKIDKIEKILDQHHELFIFIKKNTWIYKYFYFLMMIVAGGAIGVYESVQFLGLLDK